MMKFDDATRRILDRAYLGADFALRRRTNFDVLNAAPGDTVLDLGCGNGLMTVELARAVGDGGRVIGVDVSADMLESARERCKGHKNITLHDADAASLPFADNSIDKAVSVQVFEYIPDCAPALAEIRRVLRPGGRLVLGDMHFDSCCWYIDNPVRMRAMLDSWDRHVVWPDLPARLGALIQGSGLEATSVTPLAITDRHLRPDGLAQMMIILMSAYARENGHLPADEVAAWVDEQHELAREGRFFFSLTHFVWEARKHSS